MLALSKMCWKCGHPTRIGDQWSGKNSQKYYQPWYRFEKIGVSQATGQSVASWDRTQHSSQSKYGWFCLVQILTAHLCLKSDLPFSLLIYSFLLQGRFHFAIPLFPPLCTQIFGGRLQPAWHIMSNMGHTIKDCTCVILKSEACVSCCH